MDAGGSAAGGNAWRDNGDGTFTTSRQTPGGVKYSMLDLYLMGLADPADVPPFGVLQNAVPPSDVKDPLSKKALSKTSFPWFGKSALTVTAVRRAVTIDDVIAANGARKPGKSETSKWSLGIVLMVAKDATDAEIATAQSAMDTLAPKLAPAFERATDQRATMHVVTSSTSNDSGPASETTEKPDAPVVSEPAKASSTAGGCAVATRLEPSPFALLLGLALGRRFIRRRPTRP